MSSDSPVFERGPLVPIVTYLLIIVVLSGFALVATGASPSPILGMAWGVFLIVAGLGALTVEGVSPRSLFPSTRSLVPVLGVLITFWALYNLVAYSLAHFGVSGFDIVASRVVAHPLPYLAALGSALVFTAIPEEVVFRGYFQSKAVALARGNARRAAAIGVAVGAVLFALFHLPRWFLMSNHGLGPALASHLLGLTLAGLAYGLVYAVTRNLWLVALFHATMNQPPFLLTVQIPSNLHLLVGLIEYAAIVLLVLVTVSLTESERIPVTSPRQEASQASD
ncbi:type II CAAX prenyl endopeptidase Rce1 family protein [Halomicroarcula sp. GCM10025817]|uniref:CPBP family glutamic-type intramembrane protease n=1 Tax=Haloarcula TaxID=2237 RepID=UPI0023E7A6D5|nr:CPBP family glutamic-type intramembrane protease [Halomicroarcula sp. SYNS111]